MRRLLRKMPLQGNFQVTGEIEHFGGLEMINLTIDNKKVQGLEGQTVLQVAEANGIHIPTLCYMEGVHDNFSCRICVVEVEGMRNLSRPVP
jgi:NADH dehydrogenase/NADH:ubiquinone oxidoreductase subunit G